MKILMLLLIGLILAGCVSQDRREAPDWSDAALPEGEVTDPLALPLLCEMLVITAINGEQYGTWSASCWKSLTAYEIVAEGNTKIATYNASALRNTEGAYKALITAGEMQQSLTEHYQEVLKEEKKEHWLDNMIHKVIILLIGIGAAI